jgi:hypothetical protein
MTSCKKVSGLVTDQIFCHRSLEQLKNTCNDYEFWMKAPSSKSPSAGMHGTGKLTEKISISPHLSRVSS